MYLRCRCMPRACERKICHRGQPLAPTAPPVSYPSTMDAPPFAKKTLSRATFALLFCVVCAANLWVIAPFALALLLGGMLAMLASWPYRRLLAMGLKPGWAASL